MNEYTIENNKISQFILRIDLQKQAIVDFQRLASDSYLRLVKSIQHNLNVNMDTEELTARDLSAFRFLSVKDRIARLGHIKR